jgi:hypothetical protein
VSNRIICSSDYREWLDNGFEEQGEQEGFWASNYLEGSHCVLIILGGQGYVSRAQHFETSNGATRLENLLIVKPSIPSLLCTARFYDLRNINEGTSQVRNVQSSD